MKEFLQAAQLLKSNLLESMPDLKVLFSWEPIPRSNPQIPELAVVGIQKVSLMPASLGEFYGENIARCRKAQIGCKISFCASSAQQCWELWEQCMQKLSFSSELKVKEIECGEAVWQKDWGGIVLPVKLLFEILIESQKQKENMPDKVKIIRKGERT